MTEIRHITRLHVGSYLAKTHWTMADQIQSNGVGFYLTFILCCASWKKVVQTYTAQHWATSSRCRLFNSAPLFYIHLQSAPLGPNGSKESTRLSRAYCISLRCLSSYLSLPQYPLPLIYPSIPLSWIPDLAESFALHCTAASSPDSAQSRLY